MEQVPGGDESYVPRTHSPRQGRERRSSRRPPSPAPPISERAATASAISARVSRGEARLPLDSVPDRPPRTRVAIGISRETADDLPGVSAFGWHRLRAGDNACSEVCLDRLARVGRCGQLDVVDIFEARRLDGDDVAKHLADSPGTRAALQHPNRMRKAVNSSSVRSSMNRCSHPTAARSYRHRSASRMSRFRSRASLRLRLPKFTRRRLGGREMLPVEGSLEPGVCARSPAMSWLAPLGYAEEEATTSLVTDRGRPIGSLLILRQLLQPLPPDGRIGKARR